MLKHFWIKWQFLFKFRLLLGLILFILVFSFIYLKIVPFGRITYTRDYNSIVRSGKGFIYGFTPPERVDLKNSGRPLIEGDPVYFSLFTPRTFNKAKLTIAYRDKLGTSTPLIEAGVLVDNIVWRYNLKPLDNKVLNDLLLRWHKSGGKGYTFLQKNNNYVSLIDFEKDLARGELKDCPSGLENCLAVYNYPLVYDYQITDYTPGTSSRSLILDKPLRGAHQFYVYVKNEPLRLDFTLVDLNQDSKAAPVNIILSSGDKIISSLVSLDENRGPGSGQLEEKKITLEQKKLPAGVYKVEIKITDDMVIKKIVSSLKYLSFINKIWPVSSAGSLKLYTDADYLQVKALSPASLQTLNFSGQNFTISEAYQQFTFKIDAKQKSREIGFGKDDIILENNGVFAWSSSSLFNPTIPRVDHFFPADKPIKYIVADYESPKEKDGLKTATAEFDLVGAYRENGKYSFMISVPGLKTEDGVEDYLEIYKIKIELEGRTLWQKIWQ